MKHLLTSLVVGLPIVGCTSAWAALAPNYQRLAELQAVLAHPGIVGTFQTSQPIERIEYLGPDLYRVRAGNCHVDARIVSLPASNGMVGPRRFSVEPGKPSCS